MNEQNGQVDIEAAKTELRFIVDFCRENRSIAVQFSGDSARALLAHLERLEGVVEKWPTTADGASVLEKRCFFFNDSGVVVESEVVAVFPESEYVHMREWDPGARRQRRPAFIPAAELYRTRAAAEDALTPPAASSEEGGEV